MEKHVLSEMNRINFSKAVNEIYLLTDYNHKQYQEYLKWYYEKNIPRILNGSGEIIFFSRWIYGCRINYFKKRS